MTWLVCVLIVMASLDALPDPPALNPNRVEAKSDCGNDPYILQLPSCHALLSGPGVVLRWISARKIFDSPHAPNRVGIVRHAADPSPPFLES